MITTDHNLLHVGQQGVTDVDVDNTAEEDISTNADGAAMQIVTKMPYLNRVLTVKICI